MNPTVYGEVIVIFRIYEHTFYVEGDDLIFERELEYHKMYINGASEEKEREVLRLEDELRNFASRTISERQREIDQIRTSGRRVLTTNPYAW